MRWRDGHLLAKYVPTLGAKVKPVGLWRVGCCVKGTPSLCSFSSFKARCSYVLCIVLCCTLSSSTSPMKPHTSVDTGRIQMSVCVPGIAKEFKPNFGTSFPKRHVLRFLQILWQFSNSSGSQAEGRIF